MRHFHVEWKEERTDDRREMRIFLDREMAVTEFERHPRSLIRACDERCIESLDHPPAEEPRR